MSREVKTFKSFKEMRGYIKNINSNATTHFEGKKIEEDKAPTSKTNNKSTQKGTKKKGKAK